MAIFENSPKLKSPVTFKTEPTNKNKPTTNFELKIWKSDYTKISKVCWLCYEDPKKIPGVLKLAPVLNHGLESAAKMTSWQSYVCGITITMVNIWRH